MSDKIYIRQCSQWHVLNITSFPFKQGCWKFFIRTMYQLRRIHFWKEMKDCHDRKWKFCKCPFITWLVLFSKYCRFFVIVFLSITNIKVEQGWMNSCTYYRILHHGRLMHSYNEEKNRKSLKMSWDLLVYASWWPLIKSI